MAFNKTVFPVCTIDRQDIKWEDYLYELTPVEFHADSKTGKGVIAHFVATPFTLWE